MQTKSVTQMFKRRVFAAVAVLGALVCSFSLVRVAEAGVIVDFESLAAGATVPEDGYPYDDKVAVDFRILNGSFSPLRKLFIDDASAFGDLVNFGDRVGTDEFTSGGPGVGANDVPSNWGEISFTVNDPNAWRITVNSFFLANVFGFDADVPDLAVTVTSDGQKREWKYTDLEWGGHAVVEPGLVPELTNAQSIKIQWNYPHNIAIDEISYTLTEVPEPATIVGWMLGLGALGFVAYRRRKIGRG